MSGERCDLEFGILVEKEYFDIVESSFVYAYVKCIHIQFDTIDTIDILILNFMIPSFF